ncbi:hypothetical protein SAE02_48150 [Skermanella aerolata]|uniref:SMP-30/Gluconolactonase/LRE-like region domain-containing protein n=1 Tax=Skermanella aerolata TaxID=393310 RepID=A0A512DW27_9PROT|nr:hypothetical protein [Skermanella aerolata]KJB94587.1 hypothetical protein N826_10760 [Skermanella aerolata KACC 11604]GEO40667.1 hypothetical protein SAE02_48150 [Skermanella aerolata]
MMNAENDAVRKASPLVRFICTLLFVASPLHSLHAAEAAETQTTALTTTAPMTFPRTSWIGNSFSGREAWVPHNMDALFVRPDGTAFTNTYWEEGTHEVTIFKGGKVVGGSSDLHGWGRNGGYAITADDSYLYVGMVQGGCDGGNSSRNQFGLPQFPSCGTNWYAVGRYDFQGNPAPFNGGYGYKAHMLVVSIDGAQVPAHVSGLAAANGKLFVSDPAAGEVKVYNTFSMKQETSWAVAEPGPLAYTRPGQLWVLQAKSGVIRSYSPTGAALPQKIAVPGASAIAADPTGGMLLVADNGPDQNVKFFSGLDSSPVLHHTFGTQGGVVAGPVPGRIGGPRFNGLTGVGMDAKGNLYVSQNGTGPRRTASSYNTTLAAFDPSGKELYRLFAHEWVSMAVVDPLTDGAELYGRTTRYSMDYGKPAGQQATDLAVTMDRFAYPDDPRLKMSSGFVYPVALRHIQGRKFLFMTSMYATGLIVYRFDGEIAVPAAWLSAGSVGNEDGKFPASQPDGVWIWRDANGNGKFDADEYSSGDGSLNGSFAWSVDDDGSVWAAGGSSIRRYKALGLDQRGNPVYDTDKSEVFNLPLDFGSVQRLHYVPATDTLYVAGFRPGQSDDGCWGQVGKSLARYERFATRRPAKQFQIDIPSDCEGRVVPKAMDIAGDAIFIVDVSSGGHGTGLLRVYDARTGARTVAFHADPNVVGGISNTGWIDIPYGLRAYRRANGQYLVFVEDDLKSKVLMYSWE